MNSIVNRYWWGAALGCAVVMVCMSTAGARDKRVFNAIVIDIQNTTSHVFNVTYRPDFLNREVAAPQMV